MMGIKKTDLIVGSNYVFQNIEKKHWPGFRESLWPDHCDDYEYRIERAIPAEPGKIAKLLTMPHKVKGGYNCVDVEVDGVKYMIYYSSFLAAVNKEEA